MTTNEAPAAADLIGALRATGHTARQIAATVRVHVSTVYRWAKGMFRPIAARAAALASLVQAATRKEVGMNAPIIINNVNGRPVVAGSADVITAALNGAAPLTITGKHAAGDTVWLAPITEQVWQDDAITAKTTHVAREMDHAEFGRVLYAYIDMNRTDQAPQLVSLEAARQNRVATQVRAMQQRADDMVPSCDNCGDCSKCC